MPAPYRIMRIIGERRAANGQASLDPDCAATAQTSARYRLVVGELYVPVLQVAVLLENITLAPVTANVPLLA